MTPRAFESSNSSTTTYAYDPPGNLLAAADSLTGAITRTYDSLDRLMSEVTPQGAITYAYDQVSRRQTMQANGLQPVSYGYDAASRLTGITQGQQAATLAYDPSNRRTSLVLPNGITVTYTYDEASRLIAQTYTGPQGPLGDLSYTFDSNGNRIATGGSWARSLLPVTVANSNYDPSNEQLGFGDATMSFDANGNLLTQTDASGTTTYTRDARNRLTAISGPTVSASFAYDAPGRRITKRINGSSLSFQYDRADVIREVASAGDAQYLRTLSIDEMLARIDASATLYYLTDALGSAVALATSQGAVAAGYTYEPFGGTQGGDSSIPNPFQFTGRENDGTGLYYYRARYYAPGPGRFIGEDPLALTLRLATLHAYLDSAGGFLTVGTNLYEYSGGNPVARIDPFGLDWIHSQSTGQLYHLNTATDSTAYVGSGYSGSGIGLNNPAMQNVPNIGPVPQGVWNIGQQRNSPNTGPGVMDFTPGPGNHTSRTDLRIHGDNSQRNQTASRGYIVLPRNVRDQINNSGDRVLRVMP